MKGSLHLAWGPTFEIIQSVLNIPQKRLKVNLIDFKQGPKGSYTCKICGYYFTREHCGALKAAEYDEGIWVHHNLPYREATEVCT